MSVLSRSTSLKDVIRTYLRWVLLKSKFRSFAAESYDRQNDVVLRRRERGTRSTKRRLYFRRNDAVIRGRYTSRRNWDWETKG